MKNKSLVYVKDPGRKSRVSNFFASVAHTIVYMIIWGNAREDIVIFVFFAIKKKEKKRKEKRVQREVAESLNPTQLDKT
jgi:hypothetical protein